ncbi:hypothetical protein EG328_000197 [Venturia inaequalis]|uniref:Uncharacterized protein n=1 Tax=Venturia inaequalis TaxID=5025 RepID=A0A8H3Z4T0_VENIN|nr:hypothetical protein EG328_000197 [Venturia inaequalis]
MATTQNATLAQDTIGPHLETALSRQRQWRRQFKRSDLNPVSIPIPPSKARAGKPSYQVDQAQVDGPPSEDTGHWRRVGLQSDTGRRVRYNHLSLLIGGNLRNIPRVWIHPAATESADLVGPAQGQQRRQAKEDDLNLPYASTSYFSEQDIVANAGLGWLPAELYRTSKRCKEPALVRSVVAAD